MQFIEESLLIETALRLTHSESDFLLDDCRAALQKLLISLNYEAHLNKFGRRRALMHLVDILLKRARLAKFLEEFPDSKEIQIKQPVFILGLPRTGTTLLHNLFSLDPAIKTFKLWELSQPLESNQNYFELKNSLIQKTEQRIRSFSRMQPDFLAIHPLSPESPDECQWLLQNTFASNMFSLYYHIPEYFEWLMSQTDFSFYQFYKLQLQALLQRETEGKQSTDKQAIVFKSPDHLWHIPALFEVFPDARVILLHRSLSECVPSYCSLSKSLQQPVTENYSDEECGRLAMQILNHGINRLLSEEAAEHRSKFINLSYRDLVGDPATAVRGLYDKLELLPDQKLESGIQSWLHENRQHKHGKHQYSLSQFGISNEMINRSFAEYQEDYAEFL